MPSPNADWGYDVADYSDVDPALGTLADADELIAEAGARGIRVLLDLVPNHTSDQHPWFVDARLVARRRRTATGTCGPTRSPTARRRTTGCSSLRRPGVDARRDERPVLPQQLPARRSPTSTGGTRRCATSSTTSCASGSTAASPASASTSRTRSSRTASCATTRRRRPTTTGTSQVRGQRQEYNVEPARGARRAAPLARARRRVRPAAILVGETYVLDLERCRPFYGEGDDELNLAFNFLFLHAALEAERAARRSSRRPSALLPAASLAGVDRRATTTTAGSRRAGAAGDPTRARLRADDAADAARHAVPLLRRRDRHARQPIDPADGARPGAASHRRPSRNRDPPHADALDRRARRRLHRARASSRGCRSATPRRATSPTSATTPDSTLRFTRDLIALRRAAADLTGGALRVAARARRRVGVPARRRPRGRAQPVRRRGGRRGGRGDDRAGDRPVARRRGGERDARARALAGCDRPPVLDDLLSDDGWVYASTPPVAEGDPGPLPRAVRARLADHRAAGAAGAARRRGGDGARARRAAGPARRPGGRRAAGQDPPRVAAAGARLAHRARVAGARRRAALLRLGRLDLVVPRGARGDRRRRAGRRARGRLARRRRVARAGARRRRRRRPLRAAACGSGGLTQQGWRDVMGPGERGRRRRRDRAPGRLDAGAAARRRRRAGGRLRGAARARACSRARRRGRGAPRRSPSGSRPTSAPA